MGLKSIICSSQIYIGDIFCINSSNAASETLKIAGELVPEIGKVLSALGTVVEKINEKMIKDRLKNINLRIPFDKADEVIRLITS